jgi:flavin reductase (DIM6/NTAB) family NADH-FMN oxidoreductase RutF
MKLIPRELSRAEAYNLLTKLVSPRPIAMVLSISEQGVLNVAPFSYFNLVTIEPAVVMVSVQQGKEGPKDTARNIITSNLAVIHVVDEPVLDDMHATSLALPADQSELSLTSFTTTNQAEYPPYINEARAHMNVRLLQHIELGKNDVLLLQIEEIHLHERAIKDGAYELDFATTVSRVGNLNYLVGGHVVTKERVK